MPKRRREGEEPKDDVRSLKAKLEKKSKEVQELQRTLKQANREMLAADRSRKRIHDRLKQVKHDHQVIEGQNELEKKVAVQKSMIERQKKTIAESAKQLVVKDDEIARLRSHVAALFAQLTVERCHHHHRLETT